MGERWYEFALAEIDKSSRRMSEWEKGFLDSVRQKIKVGFSLTEKQERAFLKIHEKMTGIGTCKR